MSAKKITYASPEHEAADKLLVEIRQAQAALEGLKQQAKVHVDKLRREWGERLAVAVAELSHLEEVLIDREKEHKSIFFPVTGLGSCSLDLPHGALLYAKEDYVVKPRKVDVLANLERYGFEEAIRRTAAVDWEALDNKAEWPDEVLAIIGTRRETKETFAYEVKEA